MNVSIDDHVIILFQLLVSSRAVARAAAVRMIDIARESLTVAEVCPVELLEMKRVVADGTDNIVTAGNVLRGTVKGRSATALESHDTAEAFRCLGMPLLGERCFEKAGFKELRRARGGDYEVIAAACDKARIARPRLVAEERHGVISAQAGAVQLADDPCQLHRSCATGGEVEVEVEDRKEIAVQGAWEGSLQHKRVLHEDVPAHSSIHQCLSPARPCASKSKHAGHRRREDVSKAAPLVPLRAGEEVGSEGLHLRGDALKVPWVLASPHVDHDGVARVERADVSDVRQQEFKVRSTLDMGTDCEQGFRMLRVMSSCAAHSEHACEENRLQPSPQSCTRHDYKALTTEDKSSPRRG